ncbi:hypothetical protein [Streptomyces boluensis]|uniref:Regulatory protein n=1 Tax=Streptomyces boluensis TaxID=1775135 RepID=A0A964UW80_9ACTN|nr:hypothetical protein [Streptomyces boluensis]NBE56579.1 hypothetical protein [Streptomyces boluensis]
MSDEQPASSVQDRYAPQFAQELARNEQEQKELEERLRQLRDDHTALSGLLAALDHETTPRDQPVTAPAPTPEPVTDEAKPAAESVPQQRRTRKKATTTKATAEATTTQATPAKAAATAKKATGAKKVTGTKKAAAAKKPATSTKATTKATTKVAKKATTKATTKTAAKPAAKAETPAPKAEPKAKNALTLQDVISGLLVGHTPERRTVREIFDELKQHHPERASSTQSVRNALNGLLRKGAIEREEKQGAVWFGAANGSSAATTAAATTKAAQATTTPTEPTEQPEQPAQADEKVTAQANA